MWGEKEKKMLIFVITHSDDMGQESRALSRSMIFISLMRQQSTLLLSLPRSVSVEENKR